MYVCVYMCIYTVIHMHVCIHMYIHIHMVLVRQRQYVTYSQVVLRVNFYFNITLRRSLRIHQVSISCFQFVILTHNYSTTAGLFMEFLGGRARLYSQSAEFPFQLSALKCVQNVQLFTHHSGPLAPLRDQSRNVEKVCI